MVSQIKLLDDALINKIAAGEVVESPASVVKELIENSIDAGADSISIEFREGGKSFISVKDNGSGMSREDAKFALERHATSKISSEEDLSHIFTLGFRGEALASIAAVSEFSIITRKEEDIKGTEICVSGKEIEINDTGCSKGTTVVVKNLFRNIPARKKFLNTIESESRAIIDIVTRFSLGYPGISFSLVKDKKVVIKTSKTDDLRNTIASIYGSETASGMVTIDYESNNLKIKGMISKPSLSRKDRQRQTLFINKRYVKSSEISEAVKNGYHSMLFLENQPIYLLDITIDETKVDVNVHPRKEVVKIDSISIVCDEISEAVRDTLRKNDLFYDSDLSVGSASAKNNYTIDRDLQSTLEFGHHSSEKDIVPEEDIKSIKETGNVYDNIKQQQSFSHNTHIGPYKLIGQFNKSYIIIENAEGLMVIDQHAAEERVNYEILMKQLKDNAVKKQKLIKPLILEASASDIEAVNEYSKIASKAGYEIEQYGNDSIIIRAVPFIFERPSKLLAHDFISELVSDKQVTQSSEVEERITRFSCRKSVKAGEELTFNQMNGLIAKLDRCDLPFTCPHGRPTMIKLKVSDIENKFKRTG